MENAALERAIEVLGGPSETSHELRVSYWTIREWRKAGRVRDSRMAILLAEAAQAAGAPEVTVRALAGLDVVSGNGGDKPRRGRFQKGGGMITATYQGSSPDLPIVPRFPDTASQAA